MTTIISIAGPAAAREYLLERRAGFERYDAGSRAPRHGHLNAHVSITLTSGEVQDGYAGRLRPLPGDVLVQPALDRHSNETPSPRGAHVLHLPWRMETEFRGVYRIQPIDVVIREAERDPRSAMGLLAELLDEANPEPIPIWDWPDLLAADLKSRPVAIDDWAKAHGLARETISRGFRRAFGVSPSTFAGELRARSAWLQVISGTESLAQIAADAGFADQSHMTRAISSTTGAPPGAWRRMVRSGFLEGTNMGQKGASSSLELARSLLHSPRKQKAIDAGPHARSGVEDWCRLRDRHPSDATREGLDRYAVENWTAAGFSDTGLS